MMACLPMNDKVVDITQSAETADAPKTIGCSENLCER